MSVVKGSSAIEPASVVLDADMGVPEHPRRVRQPTVLIVGGHDEVVIELIKRARRCPAPWSRWLASADRGLMDLHDEEPKSASSTGSSRTGSVA